MDISCFLLDCSGMETAPSWSRLLYSYYLCYLVDKDKTSLLATAIFCGKHILHDFLSTFHDYNTFPSLITHHSFFIQFMSFWCYLESVFVTLVGGFTFLVRLLYELFEFSLWSLILYIEEVLFMYNIVEKQSMEYTPILFNSFSPSLIILLSISMWIYVRNIFVSKSSYKISHCIREHQASNISLKKILIDITNISSMFFVQVSKSLTRSATIKHESFFSFDSDSLQSSSMEIQDWDSIVYYGSLQSYYGFR